MHVLLFDIDGTLLHSGGAGQAGIEHALELAFGNAGTGDFLVTEVEFRKLADGDALPAGVLAKANDQPAPIPSAPAGAIADYRMLEGKGLVVLNHGSGGGLGHRRRPESARRGTGGGRGARRPLDGDAGRVVRGGARKQLERDR